jgi:N-acetylmuramoyl-L-alanine amidase
VRFTTQLNKTDPPALVINFSNPVNPTISTEPGKLRMVFAREALISPGAQSISLDSKIITTATYEESDGTAAVTINATAPLFARFSNGGRTITISAAKQVSTAQVEGPPAKTPPSAPQETAPPPAPSTTQQPTAPTPPVRYFAVIDGSHGGSERGAALTDQLVEKDVTLAFARQLRQDLESRGLSTLLLRDGDSTLTLDQRAGLTNRAHPAIYVCLHASSVGSGVRIYTALLPVGNGDSGPFLDWQTAQSSYLSLSRAAADATSAALGKKGVSTRILPSSLRPLNNIAAPAIAIEIAPSSAGPSALNAAAYKDLVSNAVGSALQSVRAQLEAPQ